MASLGSTNKMTRIFSAFVLVTGMLAVLTHPAGAVAAPCSVTNLRTTLVYEGTGSNLQTAIDAAALMDSLNVSGSCVGNYVSAKSVKLLGVSTTLYPTPTLDGNATGIVLTVNAGSTKLRDLVITHGSAALCQNGGGIRVSRFGSVTLLGSSSVSGNTSNCDAGGIYNSGSLIMKDSSSVSGNMATNSGGGIYNWNQPRNSSFIMRGSSSVSGNTAGLNGGGIYNADTVTMYGLSSVTGNTSTKVSSSSFYGGGGIYTSALSTLTLNGSSRVSGNMAANSGGGIIVAQSLSRLFLNGRSKVEGNTAVARAGGILVQNGATITLSGSSSITGNTSNYAGGTLNWIATIHACNGPNSFWTGTLSPNTPDDSSPPTLITC